MYINDLGQVVGSSTGPTGTHAFLWSASAGMQDLGTLGENLSEALSINNSGQVVGVSQTSLGARAFVWTSTGGMQNLNALIPLASGALLTTALGINDAGLIVAIGGINHDNANDRPADLDDAHHAGPVHAFFLQRTGR